MTDNYLVCEDGLKGVLLSLGMTYFPNDWQISKADSRILGRGIEYGIVLRQSSFSAEDIGSSATGTYSEFTWSVKAELYTKFVDEQTAWNNLRTFRADVIQAVKGSQSLGRSAGVRSVQVKSGSDVQYIFAETNPQVPVFVMQELDISIIQVVEIPEME